MVDSEPMYCAEQINIPENLGEILKAYAKEVIRQQPENIYEFSARYFAQLDQQEEEYEDEGGSEPISRDILLEVVGQCMNKTGVTRGADEVELAKLRELCLSSGVPAKALNDALEFVLDSDSAGAGSGNINWKRLVVALCSQVSGVQNVRDFVRLLMDPGMFGDDKGQIGKTEFIQLFNWWSSIDPGITAESKAALFAALATGPDGISYEVFHDAFKETQ